VASNMQEALDARAKLASPARQEDEERDEKRLSKADWTARATSSAMRHHAEGMTLLRREQWTRQGTVVES
jgi:hypothetical protein